MREIYFLDNTKKNLHEGIKVFSVTSKSVFTSPICEK